MPDKRIRTHGIKEWEERTLTTTWTGRSSSVLDIGGDKPIKGLLVDLSTSGALTFLGLDEAGNEFTVLGSDGTTLSITTTSLTENFRFYPEFGPLRRIKCINATSQVNASVVGVFSS